jgi:hypothetical protein
MSKRNTKTRKIGGQYVPHLADLIRSPAWRTLSLSARRLLDRVEDEYLRHGGNDNGKLPVTFDDFVRWGLHRHAIAPAMRECVALGVLVITKQGNAGNAEFRSPNLFLLPYLEADTAGQKWRRIATDEEAEAIARVARRAAKNQNPSAGFCQVSVPETITENAIFSAGNHHQNSSAGNHHYYLDASHCSAPGADASVPLVRVSHSLGFRQLRFRYKTPYAGSEPRTSRITTLDYPSQIPYSPDEFMTVAEAAKFAKCSESRIRNLYRDHPIAKNVLGRVMISKTELLKFIHDARSA